MTEREWNKLRLISKINPEIDPTELAKYFCTKCACYWSCEILRKIGKDEQWEIDERNNKAIKFRYEDREVRIYKCFEEKKNENKKD